MRILPLFSVVLMLAFANAQPALSAERAGVPTSLERAKELILANKPSEALWTLSGYNPSQKEFSSYHYVLARGLAATKRQYDSIEHYRLAYLYAELPADKERMLFERAEVYSGMRYYSEAAVCFEIFLRRFPKSSYAERAQVGIAEARYRLGEFRSALAHFEKAGTTHRALLGRANTLNALKRTAEAHTLFHALIEQDPEFIRSQPEAMYNVGDNYRLSGKLNDAKIFYQTIKDPAYKYRAAVGLGLIALQEKRFDAAVAAFTTAAESPQRELRREAIMHKADAHMQMGKYDAAQTELLEVKNSYPYGRQYDMAILLLARLYRKQGKFNESIALLRELIYRRNPDGAALDEIEVIILDAKDRDQEQFLKLWKTAGRWLLDPSRSVSLITIARGLRNEGKPFLDVCTWLIKYGPTNEMNEAMLLLADFYADLGDARTAGDYLKQAKTAGHADTALRIKAKIALMGRDGQKASECITAVKDPGEADLLLLLQAMKTQKNIDKEIAFCERIIQSKTVSISAVVEFADILYNAGNRRKAIAQYRAAVAAKSGTAPKDAKMVAEREWAYHRISAMTKGEDAENSLKEIQAANNPVGRFAAAELKGSQLRRRAE